jgi:tetratricopeptide (TPR) repeat protein
LLRGLGVLGGYHFRRLPMRHALALGCAVLLCVTHGGAQGHAAHQVLRSIPADVLQREVPLATGRGTAHEPIATSSPEAQAYYDQGLAALHSYQWIEAARAFFAALRLDPNCAMAHAGLSVALSNLGVTDRARAEVEAARGLAPKASPRDRRRIELRTLQLAASSGGASGYLSALDRALADDPRDVELLLLRGLAEDQGGANPGMGANAAAASYFERALAAAPDYFAPHHYLVHAYENDGRVEAALPHAEAYARLAPDVPHAHHMYAHILRRAGRVAEAIREFQEAHDLTVAHERAGSVPREYDWHYPHNLDLLGVSYQYVGQIRRAEPLLREAFELPAAAQVAAVNKRAWPAFLLAHRSPANARAAAEALAGHPWPTARAAGQMGVAQIQLAAGQMRDAAAAIDAALRALREAGPEAANLAPDFRLLQGEFFLKTGDRARGAAMIREAAGQLAAAPNPDAWTQTLFTIESAAAFARAAGEWTLASDLAEALRRHDPTYPGTHYALGLAAERRGETAAAQREYQAAIAGWRDADPDLRALQDARTRLAALTRRRP